MPMRALKSTQLTHGKAALQPSTSTDSAQTHTAQQCAASPNGSPDWKSNSNPLLQGLLYGNSHRRTPSMDPTTAKLAIKEALTPLGPAQLATVQEQLRQSRLARQQQPLDGLNTLTSPSMGAVGYSSSVDDLHNQCWGTADSTADTFTVFVQHIASAVSSGLLAQQDVARVLSSLPTSLLQQQQPPPQPQQHFATAQYGSHDLVAPLPPAAAPRSASGHYSTLFSSLQLPPAALAARAAAAVATAAAVPQQQQQQCTTRHPGCSLIKRRRSMLPSRPRSTRLLGMLGGAAAAAVAAPLYAESTGMPGATPHHDPQQQPTTAARQESASHGSCGDATAAAAAADAIAVLAQHDEDHEEELMAPGTSLAARFARLSPAVQADILRELEELSAAEDELRGLQDGGKHGGASQPRRSSRVRKVRDWDTGSFTPASGGHSASPPPAGTSYDDQDHEQCAPPPPPAKRPTLHVGHAAGPGAERDSCPPSNNSSPEVQEQPSGAAAGVMPVAADDPLSWLLLLPLPEEPEQPLQRRRRGPRRTGKRAESRKRMHRATFRRGKPQRAPAA